MAITYQYDAAGRLTSRWSHGKGNTRYAYDQAGNLTNVDYPNSTDLAYTYDALNRVTNQVDAVGTTRYSYTEDAIGRLLAEDGPFANGTVTYSYNQAGLRQDVSLQVPGGNPWTQQYAYDGARRLTNMVSGAGAFAYGYDGTRPQRVNRVGLPNGAYVTNAFDNLARVANTWLKNSTNGMLNWHGYGYNEAGWRTSATNYITNYVTYAYDELGQLKTANGYESYGSQRIHENFSYEYDAAGNLKTRNANNFHRYFTVDNVNQLSSLIATGSVVVSGAVTGNPTNVTVNGVGATLYWDKTFGRAINSWADGSNTFTAIAQDSLGRHDTNTVTVYLPRSQSFAYDDNGNLVSDGRRDFEYDDENQLTRITLTNAWKAEFTYDGKLRRRITKEYTWKNNAWTKTNEVRYIYDGMLVIQERNALNFPMKTYTRGLDLSGSLQGAGGIGGLLAISCASAPSPNTHCFYHADGNGNITALVNENQIVVARYQFDPYGNPIAATGPMAEANLYRFSSKELHANSGLYYYGFRFYEPSLQRWMNQDPIEELGGINLYRFVENDPLNYFDPDGEATSMAIGIGLRFNPVTINPATVGPSIAFSAGFAVGSAIDYATGLSVWLGPKIGDWWVKPVGPTFCPTKSWQHESPNPDKTNKRGDHKNRPDGKRHRDPQPEKPAPPSTPPPQIPYTPNADNTPYNGPPKDGTPYVPPRLGK